MRTVVASLTLAALAALAAACTHSADPGEARQPVVVADPGEPRQPVVVTREGHPLPASCRPRGVAQIVLDFFAAFNDGDERRLDERLAQKGFQWYTIGGRGGTGKGFGPPRDDLIPYLLTRHEQGEILRLREIRVNWAEVTTQLEAWTVPPTPIAAVKLRVDREADDATRRVYVGKGRINCRERTILMWNIFPEPMGIRRLCPKPPAGTPPRAALACG